MLNSAKNPQEEKEQQKIEAILEEQHKTILDRSNLLVTTIFLILGAYSAFLTATYFLASSSSLGNNSNVSNQFPSFITTLINPPPWTLVTILYPSIISIIIAFGYIWKTFAINDLNFTTKLEEKEGKIYLKHGKELLDRNKQLHNATKKLLTSNDRSIIFLLFSILLFIAFITIIKGSLFSFFGFVLIFLIVLYIIKKYDGWRKRKKNN